MRPPRATRVLAGSLAALAIADAVQLATRGAPGEPAGNLFNPAHALTWGALFATLAAATVVVHARAGWRGVTVLAMVGTVLWPAGVLLVFGSIAGTLPGEPAPFPVPLVDALVRMPTGLAVLTWPGSAALGPLAASVSALRARRLGAVEIVACLLGIASGLGGGAVRAAYLAGTP